MPGRLTLRPLCLALFASVAIPALPVTAVAAGIVPGGERAG